MLADVLHLAQSTAVWPAEFAVASAWQSPLLVAIAWAGMRAAPRLSSRTRFLLWLVVFFLAALLPLATLRLHPERILLPAHAASRVPTAHVGAIWALIVAAVWLLSSVFLLLRLLANAFELRRVAKTSTQLSPESLDAELRSILTFAKKPARDAATETMAGPRCWRQIFARRFPASHPVTLRLSREIDSPVAIGFFRPSILLPEWLAKKLTLSEMKQVVLHEMAHLERHDDWTNLLQKLFRAVFPLNLALLWTDRHLSSEREMACDDAVLDRAISPREYAICLTSLAEKRLLRHLQSLAPGAWRRRSELAGRVNRILNPGRRLCTVHSRPVVIALLSVLFCAGLVLTQSPNMVTFVQPGSRNVAPNALRPSALQSSAWQESPLLPRAHFEQASFTIPASTLVSRPVSTRRTAMPRTVPANSPRRVLAHSPVDSSLQPKHSASRKRLLKARFNSRLNFRAAAQHAAQDSTGFVFAVWEIEGRTSLLIQPDSPAFTGTAASYRSGWIVIQL